MALFTTTPAKTDDTDTSHNHAKRHAGKDQSQKKRRLMTIKTDVKTMSGYTSGIELGHENQEDDKNSGQKTLWRERFCAFSCSSFSPVNLYS